MLQILVCRDFSPHANTMPAELLWERQFALHSFNEHSFPRYVHSHPAKKRVCFSLCPLSVTRAKSWTYSSSLTPPCIFALHITPFVLQIKCCPIYELELLVFGYSFPTPSPVSELARHHRNKVPSHSIKFQCSPFHRTNKSLFLILCPPTSRTISTHPGGPKRWATVFRYLPECTGTFEMWRASSKSDEVSKASTIRFHTMAFFFTMLHSQQCNTV